jgi:hypothetical protein
VAAASYQLEHFYFGPFVRAGQVEGDTRLLAYSAGVKQDLAQTIFEQAPVPALASVPEGTWVLVRSRVVPFLLVQSQRGPAGQVMSHYVIVQSDVLRALAGNVDALKQLVEPELPVFDRLGDRLSALRLPQAGPPDEAAQVEHILEFMTHVHDRIDLIEKLLAAVVQGVQIIVQGAPPNLEARLSLVKGLLALLPPPARFGVTFATHSAADAPLDAQICFFGEGTPPDGTLIFDWAQPQVSGNVVADNYSHFIISQLRLDTDRVIKETQTLTPVAAWRIKQGDSLADALGYASKRLAVDRALDNNLPVEIDDVAEILTQDRTLDAELRHIYAAHLLSVSLALSDMQYADPIAPLLRQDAALALLTRQKFEEALGADKADLVLFTLARWLSSPLGPEGRIWLELARRAALAHMDRLGAAGDPEAVHAFLHQIQNLEPGSGVNQVVPRLIEQALPLSLRHPPLAQTLFLLAVNYLETEVLLRLLRSARFVERLPDSLGRLVPYLENREPEHAPAGLLLEVGQDFGEQWEPLVVLRLTEAALLTQRIDLVDVEVLRKLTELAQTRWGTQYLDLLLWIVGHLADDGVLPTLDDPGPLYLLRILLVQQQYQELAEEMLHQARTLYPGDLQVQYTLMVQRLFAETPLPLAQALEALKGIEAHGVKLVPLWMAYIGVLESQGEGVDDLAHHVLDELTANPMLVSVIQPRPLGALLNYYVGRQDAANTIRVADMFPDVAIQHDTRGLSMMIRMYRMMDWHDAVRSAALEMLRRYVREADAVAARRALVHFGRELGLAVREAIFGTYVVRRLLGGLNLVDYAAAMHTAAELLDSTARAYVDRNEIPTLGALVNTMQGLSGGLMDEESRAIAAAVLGLGRAVAGLNQRYQDYAPRDQERYINQLLRGDMDPQSSLDILWVIGGYFAQGQRYRLRFRHAQHPLGERSAPMLLDEAETSLQLLRSIGQALPVEKDMKLTAAAVRGEIESLWGALDDTWRNSLVRQVATDFQRMAQLVNFIGQNGDIRALQNSSSLGHRLEQGKQQPRSTLEFYRYVYGYFNVESA